MGEVSGSLRCVGSSVGCRIFAYEIVPKNYKSIRKTTNRSEKLQIDPNSNYKSIRKTKNYKSIRIRTTNNRSEKLQIDPSEFKAHTFYVSYPLRRPPPAAATTATATALNQHQPSAISPELFFITTTTSSIYPHTCVDELPRPSRPTNMASRRCRQSNRGPIGHNHCTNIEGKAQADLSSECRYWRLCRDC